MTIKKELKVYSFSKKKAIITINTKHKNLTNQLAIYLSIANVLSNFAFICFKDGSETLSIFL